MTMFQGLQVFIQHDRPKMTLSKEVPVTDAFRAEIDTWMLHFFGTTNSLADGEGWCLNGTLHVNLRTYRQLRLSAEPMFSHKDLF